MQNIPPPPPGFTLDNSSAPALGGRPVFQELPPQPSPRHPEQRQGDVLSNQDKTQDVQFAPQKHADDLIKSFSSDPAVKGYREALPVIIAATQAQPGGAGDLSVVYGWAKAMDPNSVVREGEVAMAGTASGPLQRAQFLVSQYRLQEGGQLPPDVRRSLIEEMRTKGRQLNLGYTQKYQQYRALLERSGLPTDILGPHEGDKFRAAEEQYVEGINRDRTGPADPNYLAFKGEAAPQLVDAPTQEGFGLRQDPKVAEMSPEQQSAYQAWWKANPNPTPDQLNQFFSTINLGPAPNAADIIAAAKEGRGVSTTIEERLPQDVQQRVDERLANTGAGGAAVAGGADTVTMGTFDELSALGDAIGDTIDGRGFRYSDNLAANRQFQEGLQEQSGGAYLGGQLAGGLFLPTFGARSAGQLAKVGAGYGGAYGAGSGEDMKGRALGALTGTATGAGLGYGLGKGSENAAQFFSRGGGDVPPMVGADGRLNEPLEAARPGQRVAAAKDFGIDLPMGAATDRGGAILEKGLDILPGSAGVMNDARRITERQTGEAVEGVAGKFGSARTLNEAGGEAQRGAREWMGRFEATAAKAYDSIPISDGVPASLANTKAVLDGLTSQFDSNPALAKAMESSKIRQFADAIGSGGLSWKDLKALRTRIGEAIGERRFSDDTATSDMRALYSALTDDMKDTAAALGPKATAAFNRANSLYRQGQQRIDKALVTILGNDGAKNPEAAAKAIQAMTMGGKGSGDLAKLAQIKAATVKSGAWDEIAGALIRIGGQPVDSPGRSFSPQTFVQWYSDMAEPARAMLFKPELRKELERFVAVNQRLTGTNALRNTSNTAPGILAGGVVGSLGIATMNPLLGGKIVAGMAANYGMAKLWTNPKFVQWATGYSKTLASGNASATKSQIGRLAKIGATNPQLRGAVESLQKALLSAANDNASQVGRVAASPDEGPEGDTNP